MGKKTSQRRAKTKAPAPASSELPTPSRTFVAIHQLESATQFKRAVARSYRNAIAKQVSDDLHEIVVSWLSAHECDKPYRALYLDQSNYNKWITEGTLQLRVLTQILVQRAKDFTDLRFSDGALLIGPSRAEILRIEGTLAALRQGYHQLEGKPIDLTEDEAFILLLLYRYSADHGLDRLDYSWVLTPSSPKSQKERKSAEWIQAQLGPQTGKRLAALVETWTSVCMAVCECLEDHAGLADSYDT